MKKILIFFCVLTLALGAFAGCGESDKVAEAPAEQPVAQEEQVEESPQEAPEQDTVEQKQAIVSRLLIDSFVEQSNADLVDFNENSKDTVEITVASEGETIIYTNKLLYDTANPETFKALIEAQLDLQEAETPEGETMNDVVAQLRAGGAKEAVVIVRYVDKEGTEIFSREYK